MNDHYAQVLEKQLFTLRDQTLRDRDVMVVKDMRGQSWSPFRLSNVLDVVNWPNDMSLLSQDWITGSIKSASLFLMIPREANTEGGVFPAIFGTVFMVLS